MASSRLLGPRDSRRSTVPREEAWTGRREEAISRRKRERGRGREKGLEEERGWGQEREWRALGWVPVQCPGLCRATLALHGAIAMDLVLSCFACFQTASDVPKRAQLDNWIM